MLPLHQILSRLTDPDTVNLIHHDVPFPSVTDNDYLHQTAVEILHILQNKKNKILSLAFGNPTTNAFIELPQVLKWATSQNNNTSPLIVVPKIGPVSSPRVTHNVTPSETVQHNNVVPLIVPKNNHVSSPKVH